MCANICAVAFKNPSRPAMGLLKDERLRASLLCVYGLKYTEKAADYYMISYQITMQSRNIQKKEKFVKNMETRDICTSEQF